MQDKNGIEMRTGDIVKVENAYSKCDNGYWLITHSPGDENWCGKDHSLTKLGKTGKISYAKGSISFWPILSFIPSHFKRIEANAYNKENATIEVVGHHELENPWSVDKDNEDHLLYVNWKAN